MRVNLRFITLGWSQDKILQVTIENELQRMAYGLACLDYFSFSAH